MNTETLARTTFVLSRTAHDDLSYLSRRIGRSRSSLVREVLEPSIAEMARLLRGVPDQPMIEDLESFRSEALLVVDGMSSEARRLLEVPGHE